MTLIVCLEGKDGLALVSDSRGTFGDPNNVTAQNDTIKKVHKVSEYVGVLVSGAGELSVSLIDELKQEIKNKSLVGVTPILTELRDVATKRYSDWFKNGFLMQPAQGSDKPLRPVVNIIVAGYDVDANGNPTDRRIYSLNSLIDFAPQRHDYGFALGGVPQYALYILNRLYTKDRTVDELIHLGVYTITETASQDGKVGGPVQGLKITKQGKAAECAKGDIDVITKSNEKRSKRLKTSFFK